MKKSLIRVAPFLIAGPISGPFMAGVYYNWREGRPVLASLYAIAVLEAVVLAPWLIGTLTVRLL